MEGQGSGGEQDQNIRKGAGRARTDHSVIPVGVAGVYSLEPTGTKSDIDPLPTSAQPYRSMARKEYIVAQMPRSMVYYKPSGIRFH